jgi:hypothetical protein
MVTRSSIYGLIALAVLWTLIAAGSAWLDLPRGTTTPHDPAFMGRLSTEAAVIVQGAAVTATPERGAPLWSDEPRLFRMANGARLTFPAGTTAERAAIVENEYRQIVDASADAQRASFLLDRLMLWLAPLLLAAGAFAFFAPSRVGSRAAGARRRPQQAETRCCEGGANFNMDMR